MEIPAMAITFTGREKEFSLSLSRISRRDIKSDSLNALCLICKISNIYQVGKGELI
jgi:hypothetical protein